MCTKGKERGEQIAKPGQAHDEKEDHDRRDYAYDAAEECTEKQWTSRREEVEGMEAEAGERGERDRKPESKEAGNVHGRRVDPWAESPDDHADRAETSCPTDPQSKVRAAAFLKLAEGARHLPQ